MIGAMNKRPGIIDLNFFVELHNRADRKAQVTDFLSFLKDEHYYLQVVGLPSILVVVSAITHLD